MLDQGPSRVWCGRSDVQPNCVDSEVLDARWQWAKIDETRNVRELAYLSESEICFSTRQYGGHLRA